MSVWYDKKRKRWVYKFWKDKIAIPVRRFFDQKRGSQGGWSKTATIR